MRRTFFTRGLTGLFAAGIWPPAVSRGGALRLALAPRQAHHLACFGRRCRLHAELANDPHRTLDELDVCRELAGRVIEVVLEANANVPAEEQCVRGRRQLSRADRADVEDRVLRQMLDHY